MKHAEAKIQELKERFSSIIIEDKSANFNTELTSVIELENMLDIAETIVYSALSRKESRGSHQRTDFTVRDDENFLRHSLAYKTDAESRINTRMSSSLDGLRQNVYMEKRNKRV
ncbi:MAG: hypothetical protein Ct9H300mP28_27440 [Pseudomonadota bacterium]|nr:MAG: hypothetical protein Ct9H300mP28_27440 [Pseudomonadota bacterium]